MADAHDEREDERSSDHDGPRGASAATRFRHGFVRGIGIAVVALFTAFALANRQYVEFGWLFGSTEIQEVSGERVSGGIPLIVLLVVAFLLGAIVGGVVVTLRGRARRRAAG